jgi:4-hydroxy-tetrahydrodipicolinate synthase
MAKILKGAFAVLATPMKPDQSIDEKGLRENIQWVIREGIHGVITTGSTGEYVSLTEGERKRVTEIAAEEVRGRVPLCIGAGAETTRDAVMYTRFAKEVGADAVMIAPSYYCRPNPDEVYHHYKQISDAVDLPIMIYNNPFTTKVDLAVETVIRLSEISNVKYIKESSGDVRRIGMLALQGKGKIVPFAGFDDLLLESYLMGAEGGVIVAGNICPKMCSQLFDLALVNKDYDKARALYFKMLPLLNLIEGPMGKIVQLAKKGAELVGHAGGPSRSPRLPLTAEEENLLRKILREMGLI